MTTPNYYLRIWLLSGIILIAAMVIIGGITRLTGSGLSMVEWKPVTGIVPPLSETDWQLEFDKYKQFPEYQKLNVHMTLQEFKQIFFWEYLHRLLGRLIGVVFLIPFLIFYFKGWIERKMVLPLIIIFLLGGLQGFVGWYMVKSGLNTLPHVSHFRLALHQGMALLLIAEIWWTVLSLQHEKRKRSLLSSWLYTLSIVSLILLICQITFGAFVAGLKAGYSYNNFPWIGDTLFPNSDIIASDTYFNNGVLLQFTHRWLGFIVLFFFIVLYVKSKSLEKVHHHAKLLLILTSVQVLLGIFTLLLSVPIVLGVLHQFVAILLLMVMIKIIHAQRFMHTVTL
jgi:cytochrome c oxidase assembly protein subunit 15